ncbi:MAG: sulfatase [Verrucomicrobiae bacterium]|nr:sulfatase [Verrucomicrobiae bacterium]
MIRVVPYLLCCALGCGSFVSASPAPKPNVLFIALDDLNDWIGCMGGNPQSITPNFDRLAADGMLFTNAHCSAPACNPSRVSIFSGISPHKSGIYTNAQVLRDVLPDATLMPRYFSEHGYWSAGSGKLLHYIIDARSWDDYFPEKETEDPFPRTLYPDKRPVSLPVGGPWQYEETDWGPLDATDEEFGGDWLVSDWIGKQLAATHDKPFFLACGIYRPHEPWFVPKKYFDRFPLESIQLPPGYKEADLDDVPEEGQQLARNRYFPHILKEGQWKQGIQGYLASIHFADAMLGRVLDSLENGPNKDNTIVVLWSDHGWQLGEKEHWQKYTAWRLCTRVPLMVKVPAGASPALPDGVKPGSRCDEPVSLVGLFPTLNELCGLPAKDGLDGTSIVPLLKDPSASKDSAALTFLHDGKSVAVSGREWRYIRYAKGGEELYHISADPFEWNNVAADPAHAGVMEKLRARIPATIATVKPVAVKDLPAVDWHPCTDPAALPPSKPDGANMRFVLVNRREQTVRFHFVGPRGKPATGRQLGAAKRIEIKAKPGTVWAVTGENEALLGYFVVGDRAAKGVIR